MRALVLAGLVGCGFAPVEGTAIVEKGIDGFTGDLSGGSVASRGAIEPETYFPGGLRARGYHNEGVTATTTSADLAGLFTQPSGQIVGWNFAVWGDDPSSGYPHGLGLANHDHWSVVIDGEIWLPAGTSTYVLAADDAGFVEIDVDGAITGVHASYVANGTLTITTAHDGWYPIKGAMSESIGSATFYLIETAPEAATTAIPPSHLRAKTTAMRGLVAYLFYLQELEIGPAMWLDPGPIDHDAFTPGPADYAFSTTFSERLAGQILIDTAGVHAFAVDADDSYRLFIDGQLVADPLAIRGTPNEEDFAPSLYDYDALRTAFVGAALAPAWHLTVTSSVAQSGSVSGVVMASYHGGPLQPFTPNVVYTSQPHATPGARVIDQILVDATLAGATMTLAVRTAGSEARLATAAWTRVDNGAPILIAGDELVQYQLALAGDGWMFPSVERVEVDYH